MLDVSRDRKRTCASSPPLGRLGLQERVRQEPLRNAVYPTGQVPVFGTRRSTGLDFLLSLFFFALFGGIGRESGIYSEEMSADRYDVR